VGQTTDVLITMDKPPARYYVSAQGVPFDNTTTAAVIEYDCGCATDFGPKIQPASPALLASNDTAAATTFAAGIKSPKEVKVHEHADEYLFFTVGLGLFNCKSGELCSFVFPQKDSLLHAHYYKVPACSPPTSRPTRWCSSTTRRRTSAAGLSSNLLPTIQGRGSCIANPALGVCSVAVFWGIYL
jgi:hypothetical protein